MISNLNFISEKDLKEHICNTIENYGKKLQPYDLKKFNKNIIDPIKVLFDKNVYNVDWKTLISNEIFRQRDKADNNEIGYFHQKIFKYIQNCRVPDNGKEGGWDVIYESSDGVEIIPGMLVHRIYVEMKNKHNTMNSASAGKTFIKMQDQLLKDDDCACVLVEAIAKKSQNIKWETSVNGNKVGHKLIRRMSIDQFYALITNQKDAFLQICKILPDTINDIIQSEGIASVPHDTVYDDLSSIAQTLDFHNDSDAMIIAFYLLGFPSYIGFSSFLQTSNQDKILSREQLNDYSRKLLQLNQKS